MLAAACRCCTVAQPTERLYANTRSHQHFMINSLLWSMGALWSKPAGRSRYISKADRQAALAACDGKCWHCDVDLHGQFHADHMIPWSVGGGNHARNLVASCASCNLSRGNLSIAEFDRREGRQSRCQAFTLEGKACRKKVDPGKRKYCHLHCKRVS